MAITNTATRYGGVAKSFHWATALLILSLIPMGLIANQMPYDTSEELARKAWLFSLHKTLGVAVFFVALARIAWAISQPKPGLLNADKPLESTLAEAVHWLLYGSLVIVPLSGWIHHAATTGFAPIWWPFGQSLPLVPKSEAVAAAAGGLHYVLTKVLGLAIVLHVAGALKHHLIDRDNTLRRMLPGEAAVGPLPEQHKSRAPLIVALVVWAAALGVGAGIGAYAPHGSSIAQTTLAEVRSEWSVQEGSIAITVGQFGSDVTGSFADWTAAIDFDDTVGEGPAGTVETTIAISSLTLGSVTDQAMGADFFDAATHPTALFRADISALGDGIYEAVGTLSIKDQSVPVTLPFTLRLDGDVAAMEGTLTLDRRSFSIGDNMADESSLAFAVGVDIALTAARGAP